MQNTHNTGDCKKYNSDGTLKKGFAGKNAQRNPRNENAQREQKSNYVQLSAKITKLEKSNKKLKRANKKRRRDSDSDSDSSWSDGSGSTGNLDNKCTKRNKINHDVKSYPSPNKATDNLDFKNLDKKNTLKEIAERHRVRDLPNCRTLNCQVHISIVWTAPSIMHKKEESLLWLQK